MGVAKVVSNEVPTSGWKAKEKPLKAVRYLPVESLDRKENKVLVEKTASEFCNANLRVNFILVAEMKHDADARSNPFVKSALEMFGGRVVKEE